MRLRITDVNYSNKFDWIYKLSNESNDVFYIMDRSFYKTYRLKSPISKHELDYFERDLWITAEVKELGGRNIVVALH